ncbi:hypothetical protein F4808DRAFT_442890 [Astrocystis sublimbata]|nr:hypothetical protein F4808DRAFT_442890 [Astrocystis sublimbata]
MSTALPVGNSTDMSPAEEATSRSLILALIHRYASAARENVDSAMMKQLFEHDATFTIMDRAISPADIGAIIRDDPPALLRHHVTTIDVQFVSADEAHCQTYVLASTDLKITDHFGRWDSVVRRQEDGRWLFSKTVVVLEGVDPDGWLAASLNRKAAAES